MTGRGLWGTMGSIARIEMGSCTLATVYTIQKEQEVEGYEDDWGDTSRDTSVGVITKGAIVSHVMRNDGLLNVESSLGRRVHSSEVVGDFGG